MKTQNDAGIRNCPYCTEQINIAAKVCPRCRQWLTALSLRNPAMAAILMCLSMFILIVGLIVSVARLVNPGVGFSDYRDTVSVVESRMSLGKTDEGIPTVNIIAIITNKSDVAWKDLQFDSRFYNKAATLIDARPYSVSSTILPHSDLAVRIVTKPLKDLSEYETQKVYIRNARDARSRL